MKRNHIHLAQGVAGKGIISGMSFLLSFFCSPTNSICFVSKQGMRTSSQILIFIDLQKALDAGIKFFLSDNGVILTEGDGEGFLKPEFFEKVENAKGELMIQG